jgi:hypothetical protein
MKMQTLREVQELAVRAGHVFIATADPRGQPHVAAAGRLALTPERHILVTEWFCPVTLSNLQSNPRLSVVVWDAATDSGYQLTGELEAVKETGTIDGYAPNVEGRRNMPQVERQLLLHVNKVLEFKRSPHSDIEE